MILAIPNPKKSLSGNFTLEKAKLRVEREKH